MKVEYISSDKKSQMQRKEVTFGDKYSDKLCTTEEERQTIKGFGACFNELSWQALQQVEPYEREEFIKDLFSAEGCGFNSGRVPIGANDYSLQWYSCDDTESDYSLEHFNIERDKEFTIPFIKRALVYCPDLHMFASPWSPPAWMKTHNAYNFGRIRMEKQVLVTYAKYFTKFVQEYAKEGIKINQVHVQNEPMADQKFPSCLWYGDDMREFIAGYLGPEFENSKLDTEIWLGTINGPFIDFRIPGEGAPYHEFYDQFANTILSDEKARSYITGVGVQWGGKHQLEQIEISYPELRIMQTESECGDGKNEWEQAEYIFMQMWFYFRHSAERYIYWNMVLPEGGESTWGWRQNSLCTVDSCAKIQRNPEYYLMKHFSKYVKPGAKLLASHGRWASNAVMFRNPDGQLIIVLGNTMNRDREFTFDNVGKAFSAIIPAHTFNTFIISE